MDTNGGSPSAVPNTPGESVTSKAALSFVFEGESEVDASLLGQTITNFAYITNELAKVDESTECTLKVLPFKKGSFQIDYEFISVAIMGLLPVLQSAAQLTSILKGIFDIKKAIKGEKPRSITPSEQDGYVIIDSPDGTKIQAPLGSEIVFTHPQIDKRISEISNAVHLNNPKSGFSIILDDDEVSHYSADDVHFISEMQEFAELSDQSATTSIRTVLPIKSLDLLGASSWKFMYGTRTITAKIGDAGFMNQVHSGTASYKAGDKLEVQLETTIKQSSSGMAIGEQHTISKVYRHIHDGDQISFF